MSISKKTSPLVKIPLRLILIAPFVTLTVLVTGLTGYLSFRNSQQAVNDVAHQLRQEITARIESYVFTFLNRPHQINQLNAKALQHNWLAVNNQNVLEGYLWEQLQNFDSVSSIYFGNLEGGLVDAGREGAQAAQYVIVTDNFSHGTFRKYATNNQGEQTTLLATVPNFDARTRPWYINAVKKGAATWSEPYILFTGQDMSIAASRPVYNKEQQLLGVVSVDIFLSQLNHFLQSLAIGKTGQSFIIERSGLLIAASTGEKPFTTPGKAQTSQRLSASESQTPLIRAATEALIRQFGSYYTIHTEQPLEFEFDGQRQFLSVAPIQDNYGIDWLVVVVIPEADFMAQINANNRNTAILIGFTLLGAVILGIVTTQWLARPILELTTVTRLMAQGKWSAIIPADWIAEIGELGHSFNQMAERLQQMLVNLTTEITERKRAEEYLRQSEARNRAILNAIPDLLFHFNRQGVVLDFKAKNKNELLIPVSHLIGSCISDNLPPQVAQLTLDRIAQALDTGQMQQFQYQLTMSTGLHTYEARLVVIGPDETLAIIRDISEQAKLEQMKSDFINRASHELRTPLTTATMMVELIQEGGEQEELAEFWRILQMELRRQRELVEDLLTVGRLESGTLTLKQEPLELNPILSEAIMAITPLADTKQIELITSELSPCLPQVNGDPNGLKRVFINLLNNAVKFTPNQGKVCLQAASDDNGVTVWVRDTGMGIPAEDMPHLFERFFRASNATHHEVPGSGVGLYIVKSIVEGLNGRITVDSVLEQGTTFVVWLPRSQTLA